MAYVVPRRGGLWDIRESRGTPDGPRSYTLASFRALTPEVLERAQRKASKPVDAQQLRGKAIRAGAPVEPATADRAAVELLAELNGGRPPRPALKQLLLDALGAPAAEDPVREEATAAVGGPLCTPHHAGSANARAAAAWIGATPKRRGEALLELLALVDQFPHRPLRERERFPRIESRAA